MTTLPRSAVSFVATKGARARDSKSTCHFLLASRDYEAMLRNPRVHRTPRVWQVKGKLSDLRPARLNLVKTSHGYRLRDPDVYREFDNLWNAMGISVDACMEAALASLKASRVLAPLRCPKCS